MMRAKRLLPIIIVQLAFTITLHAEVYYEPEFLPYNPELLGQGGSFVAVSSGYNALFTNPAGFMNEDGGSFTLLGTTIWTHFIPDQNSLSAVQTFGSDPVASISSFNDLMTSTGFGFGVNEGIAYVGNGLGLGLFAMADVFAIGPNTLGVTANPVFTLGFVGGLSLPLSLGPVKGYVGGDLRPMLRMYVPDMTVVDLLSLFGETGGSLSDVDAYHGVALGADLGFLFELGPLSLGLALRDIGGTRFHYSISPFDTTLDALKTGRFPSDGTPVSEDDSYIIPMSILAGFGFHPVLGAVNYIIDLKVHAEYKYRFVPADLRPSFFTGIHAGAELTLLSFFKIRAGIQQGYVTAGGGFHMLFLDFNAAFYSRELGSYAGAKRNSGLTAELAFRLK